jgi:ubiquinone/menaquinone biosynthesis C-methylase UbiE
MKRGIYHFNRLFEFSSIGGVRMSQPLPLYDLLMKPLEKKFLKDARRNLMSQAGGSVLEIGAGTGANLPFYPFDRIDRMDFLDLSIDPNVRNFPFPRAITVQFVEGRAESLPFQDQTYDYVVFSLVLCSVTDQQSSLNEVLRVLKPGGRMLYIEHKLPEEGLRRSIFHRLTPVWKKVANNCHLNRETPHAIEAAGFKITEQNPLYKDIFVGGVAEKPGLLGEKELF